MQFHSIGERLRFLRESKGLSQRELAEKIGIDRTTYSSYELNRRRPDPDVLARMSSVFHAPTDFIISGILDSPELDTEEMKLFARLRRDILDEDWEEVLFFMKMKARRGKEKKVQKENDS